MRMSIYLSDEIANIIRCYGTVNDVINKILEEGAKGTIDIMEKPRISEKKGGHYYQIEVREPNYLELLEVYGPKSSKISLRRLIYWFVENEIYEELNWEPTDNYIEENISRSYDVVMNLKQLVYKATKLLPQYNDEFLKMRESLNKIEEELWYV